MKKIMSLVLMGSFVIPGFAYPKTMGQIAQAMTTAHQSALLGKFVRRGITSLEGITDIAGIENVTVLRLEGNKIRKLTAGTFDSPKFKNLRVLDLGLNELETIEPGAFKGLENLRVLFLNGNRLKKFKPGTLIDLKGLWGLSIGDNPKHLPRTAQRSILTQLKKEALEQLPTVYWIYAGTMKRKLFKQLVTAGSLLAAAVAIGVILGFRAKYSSSEEINGDESVQVPAALAHKDNNAQYATQISDLNDYRIYQGYLSEQSPTALSDRFNYLNNKLTAVSEALDQTPLGDIKLREQLYSLRASLEAAQRAFDKEREEHNRRQTPES